MAAPIAAFAAGTRTTGMPSKITPIRSSEALGEMKGDLAVDTKDSSLSRSHGKSQTESEGGGKEMYPFLTPATAALAAALIAAVTALYLGVWRPWLRRPKLKIYFCEKHREPYFHNLAFGSYEQPIDFVGQVIHILKPGLNVRVKVHNHGKATARGVQVRVEKIVLAENNSKAHEERLYHPTTVKWSGERDWGPVDIVPDSHFFLDVFWSISEEPLRVFEFNKSAYRGEIDERLLRDIVDRDICPSGETYWNVWVDTSYDRGIPVKYDFQGDIEIYFVVNGENCGPLRFEAAIAWSRDAYNSPSVHIKERGYFVNND
jgi:hypothetical protein